MPHATTPEASEPEDADFDNVMRQLNGPFGEGNVSFDFMTRELDTGEKADDAIDYEDIDDEELPEEEAGARLPAEDATEAIQEDDQIQNLFDEPDNLFGEPMENDAKAADDGLDDLFGDEPAEAEEQQEDHTKDLFSEEEEEQEPPPPVVAAPPPPAPPPLTAPPVVEPAAQLPEVIEEDRTEKPPVVEKNDVPPEENMDPATLRAWKLQQSLFAMSSYGPDNPPAPPENVEELLQSLFPGFDRNVLPRFLELIPTKKAHFVGKLPVKPPKPVMPTKLSVEISQDQEKSFKTGGQGHKRPLDLDNLGVVPIIESPEEEGEDVKEDVDLDLNNEEPLPGGITLQDIQIVCADWDVHSQFSEMDIDEEELPADNTQNVDDDGDWLFETTRPAKKRKVGPSPSDIITLSHIDIPLLDEPEKATSRVAKKVTLDMNDPHLVLDERSYDSVAQKPKALGALGRDELDVNVTRRLHERYNISNDQAYDTLKQNHQNKIRSTLGNVTLDHSMPALRLQWPYYKTELARAEARSFHRPSLTFRPGQTCWFKNPAQVKRKHQKSKDIKTVFNTTRDLSMADNSSVLLLENSEEVPTMMSNFGMANRFINYYRRKSIEDPTRPKAEIGETVVLLPQDKSPFSLFGHVDPGEITPSISNSMYRAPLFQHKAKPTDFLVVRSSTGSGGSNYYLRNIENLYVVGQQLPSVDVPGPHSRKITTVAKNRMKMLVYRLLKKSPDLRLSISDVTAHIPGTSDMQNRQKVKDFLQHDKDSKYWVPMEPVPDQDTIRSWVQPEDVCLLESMQVGQQHLHDTGYGVDAETGGDDDEDAEGESFEQLMAPWKTTRNFLLASQGKAMLKLHGEGDPTGRGEGFSFIKTSMKGGFKAVGESVEDKLDAQRLKELGGHSYNVARQQRSYETSIRRIWDAQAASLSSTVEQSDDESDVDKEEEDFGKPTPRSEAPTPAPLPQDETTSQYSKMSATSQRNKVLRITRKYEEPDGNVVAREQIVRDPRVIRKYLQYRHSHETSNTE